MATKPKACARLEIDFQTVRRLSIRPQWRHRPEAVKKTPIITKSLSRQKRGWILAGSQQSHPGILFVPAQSEFGLAAFFREAATEVLDWFRWFHFRWRSGKSFNRVKIRIVAHTRTYNRTWI